MAPKSSVLILLIAYSIFTQLNTTNIDCKNSKTSLSGCITCDDLSKESLAFDIQSSTYICTDILGCVQVSGQECVLCQNQYDLVSASCLQRKPNCLKINTTTLQCQQCYPNYQLLSDHTCKQQTLIEYCQNYTNGTCTACMTDIMDPTNNCLINTQYCNSFDFNLWRCITCPSKLILHSSGLFCITLVSNCIQYVYLGCIRCQKQYQLNSTINKCIFNQQINYQIFIENALTSVCLNQGYIYSQGKSSCIINKIDLMKYPYCMSTDSPATKCLSCITGFYLVQASKTCSNCQFSIQNCLACKNQTFCQVCISNSFVSTNNLGVTTCVSCSLYACQQCYFNVAVQCLTCEKGYTLNNGNCFQCPNNTYFSLYNQQCLSCPFNCTFCDQSHCNWCDQGFVLNNANNCVQISSITSASQLNYGSVYEILLKMFPLQQKLIYNDSVQLMSSCLETANIYACMCSNTTSRSSLCETPTIIDAPVLLSIWDVIPSKIITGPIFLQQTDMIRLMSQLTDFDNLTFSLGSPFTIPVQKIAALLQIFAHSLQRKSQIIPVVTSSSTYISNKKRLLFATEASLIEYLRNLISTSFSHVLSVSQTSVIYGNGYYFKYYPTANGADQNAQFVTIQSPLDKTSAFVWFGKQISSKSLTGNFYVFSTNSSVTISLKQLIFPSQSYSYVVYQNKIVKQLKIIQKADNFIQLTIQSSSPTTIFKYSIEYQLIANQMDSLYTDQRVQRIFYQIAFIYVLVFLLIYLFFIPFCSIVDLCQNQAHRRKRVRSEDITISQQRDDNSSGNQKPEIQTQVVISVNYKDFFPIYNISNTPRPRRIVKLCLFILNIQHSVTFLTLIYFNLKPDYPVTAVVLGLPAYFCTIIMGYICGFLTVILPGYAKYLINIIPIAYWILWIALMPKFISTQYNPYVLVFFVVFIFIDMIIDTLETFVVYFIIKQSDKQIRIFRCLAVWLSKRGFYDYDKLAKQLQ